MNNCIAAINSLNKCIKASRVLASSGYFCKIVNLDPKLTKYGCAYGIEYSCTEESAIKGVLRREHIDVTQFIKGTL